MWVFFVVLLSVLLNWSRITGQKIATVVVVVIINAKIYSENIYIHMYIV